MGVFIFGYGLCRFFVEIFREPDAQFVTLANPNGYIFSIGDYGLSMGQLLSVPMIAAGFLLLLLALSRKGQISV